MSSFKVIFGLTAILVAIYYMSSHSGPRENTRSEKCGDNQNASLETLEEDDYYGILELKDDASTEEIRLSFRRLSRIHHPDKNLDDQEGATKRCAKVNRAYQTLSDRTSRAKYDQEKNSKYEPPAETTQTPQYPGYYPTPPEEQGRSRWGWFAPFGSAANRGSTPQPHDHGDGCPGCVFRTRWGICSAHLQHFYLPDLYAGMGDNPPGFFALYRSIFDDIIAVDECKFTSRSPLSFPSFGHSDWPYNGPYVKVSKKNKKKARGPRVIKKDAKTFYDFWTTFSSQKDFAWAKVMDVDGVVDSTMKKFLQKENKISQDAARNDYNETVRNLAKQIRKIDPRCR